MAPNATADPAANAATVALLANLYAAGAAGKPYSGTGISAVDLFNTVGQPVQGLFPEFEQFELTTGEYPAILGIDPAYLVLNGTGSNYGFSVSWSPFGLEIPNWSLFLPAAKWAATLGAAQVMGDSLSSPGSGYAYSGAVASATTVGAINSAGQIALAATSYASSSISGDNITTSATPTNAVVGSSVTGPGLTGSWQVTAVNTSTKVVTIAPIAGSGSGAPTAGTFVFFGGGFMAGMNQNFGNGVLVSGSGNTALMVPFTYTTVSAAGVLGGVSIPLTGASYGGTTYTITGSTTVVSGAACQGAQLLGATVTLLGGTAAYVLQYNATAYQNHALGTSSSYAAALQINANTNLNLLLDEYATFFAELAAVGAPVTFRLWTGFDVSGTWFGALPWFSQLWQYCVAYLTGNPSTSATATSTPTGTGLGPYTVTFPGGLASGVRPGWTVTVPGLTAGAATVNTVSGSTVTFTLNTATIGTPTAGTYSFCQGFPGQPTASTPAHNVLYCLVGVNSGTGTVSLSGATAPPASMVDLLGLEFYSETPATALPTALAGMHGLATGYSNIPCGASECYSNGSLPSNMDPEAINPTCQIGGTATTVAAANAASYTTDAFTITAVTANGGGTFTLTVSSAEGAAAGQTGTLPGATGTWTVSTVTATTIKVSGGSGTPTTGTCQFSGTGALSLQFEGAYTASFNTGVGGGTGAIQCSDGIHTFTYKGTAYYGTELTGIVIAGSTTATIAGTAQVWPNYLDMSNPAGWPTVGPTGTTLAANQFQMPYFFDTNQGTTSFLNPGSTTSTKATGTIASINSLGYLTATSPLTNGANANGGCGEIVDSIGAKHIFTYTSATSSRLSGIVIQGSGTVNNGATIYLYQLASVATTKGVQQFAYSAISPSGTTSNGTMLTFTVVPDIVTAGLSTGNWTFGAIPSGSYTLPGGMVAMIDPTCGLASSLLTGLLANDGSGSPVPYPSFFVFWGGEGGAQQMYQGNIGTIMNNAAVQNLNTAVVASIASTSTLAAASVGAGFGSAVTDASTLAATPSASGKLTAAVSDSTTLALSGMGAGILAAPSSSTTLAGTFYATASAGPTALVDVTTLAGIPGSYLTVSCAMTDTTTLAASPAATGAVTAAVSTVTSVSSSFTGTGTVGPAALSDNTALVGALQLEYVPRPVVLTVTVGPRVKASVEVSA